MKSDEELHKEWNVKAALAFLCLALTFVMLAFAWVTKCSIEPDGEKIYIEGRPCDQVKEGDLVGYACKDGKPGSVLAQCQDGTIKEVFNTCGVGNPGDPVACENAVTFDEVLKPLVANKCASCHAVPVSFIEYNVVKNKIDEMIRRIELSAADPRRMPKEPAPELTPEEKQIFKAFRDQGLIESKGKCQAEGKSAFTRYPQIEQALLLDLAKLNSDDRPFTRYLVATHVAQEKKKIAGEALDLGLNSLAVETQDLVRVTPVTETLGIYRIDLRSYELSQFDWLVVENNDKVNIVSQTDLGKLIQGLTQTRKPWLHFDNALDVMLQAKLYYQFTETQFKFADQARKIGVNVQRQIQGFEPLFIGFNGSIISQQKNRLLVRFEGTNGAVWATFDVEALAGVAQRNLFAFPLLDDVLGIKTNLFSRANFRSDASEIINVLPNGLFGFSLYNARGELQEFAPITIVRDVKTPLNEVQIDAAIDCFRCHAQGWLPAVDQIKDHVRRNAAEFQARDFQLIQNLYRGAGSNAAQFLADNKSYKVAVDKLGQTFAVPDPINDSRDQLRLDWNLAKLAAFLFLQEETLRLELDRSQNARAEVGQILTGGSITFDQLVQTLPDIIRDLALFEEPVNGQN